MEADSWSEPRRVFGNRQLYEGTSPDSEDEDSGNVFGQSATSTSSRQPEQQRQLAAIPEHASEVIDLSVNDNDNDNDEVAAPVASEAEEVSAPRQIQANVIDQEQREELRRRQELRNCALCWEELPYIAGGQNGQSNDRSAMLQKIQDFRKIIFRFEQLLAGRQNDETIFTGMMHLRSLFVEQYLEEHGYRYRKWTLTMLRNHYNPVLGHKFDAIREIKSELEELRRIRRWQMKVRTRAHCDALRANGSLRSPLPFIVSFICCIQLTPI